MNNLIDSGSAERLRRLHETMLLIRLAEQKASALFAEGEIPGFIHLSIGQEAIAAGIGSVLRVDDTVASTHRGHGHALAKGLALDAFFSELMGKAQGVCQGHGGSMHVADLSVGMLGANGIVGGGLPIAVGSAFAHQLKRNGNVAVAFFGDGALAEGAFHECLNLSVLWRLPILFACENNGWSEFSPTTRQVAFDLEQLAAAFGLPIRHVDGNDVQGVADAAAEAIDAMRAEGHPCMFELATSRVRGHFEGDPQKYRSDDSRVLEPDKDPIARNRKRLSALGYDDVALDDIAEGARRRVDEAVASARSGSDPDLQAAIATVYTAGSYRS